MMHFWIYGQGNTSLDKRLKCPTLENPSTIDKVNGPKHSWNLNHSTFTTFIDPCEHN